MDPDAYQFHRVPNIDNNKYRDQLLASDQVSTKDIDLVWHELEQVLQADVPGAVVEFGCYVGTTSLFIRRLLDEQGQSAIREFHVYDSFDGLPTKAPQDSSAAGVDFTAGKLAVSKKEFLNQFRAAHRHSPVIHKDWFSDLTAADIPEPIAFAFLDGDFYDSILDSLKLVWPRLSPGGVVLIDDYGREALPGVERAVGEYFRGQAMAPQRVMHNIACFKKP